MNTRLFGAFLALFILSVVGIISYTFGETNGYSTAADEAVEQAIDLHAYFLDPIEVNDQIKYNVWDIESDVPLLIEGSLSEIDSAIVASNM